MGAYMTQTKGDHRICVSCPNQGFWHSQPLKWELTIDMGDTEFTQGKARQRDVKGLERTVMATYARAEAIAAENEYEKATEMEFRHAHESIDGRVVHVAVFVMIAEGVLCFWQISHLRAYFKSEMLI